MGYVWLHEVAQERNLQLLLILVESIPIQYFLKSFCFMKFNFGRIELFPDWKLKASTKQSISLNHEKLTAQSESNLYVFTRFDSVNFFDGFSLEFWSSNSHQLMLPSAISVHLFVKWIYVEKRHVIIIVVFKPILNRKPSSYAPTGFNANSKKIWNNKVEPSRSSILTR